MRFNKVEQVQPRVMILLPFVVLATGSLLLGAAPPQVPTQADVSYGPHPLQLMDIYLPKDGGAPCPVLICYGGIWKPSKHVPDLNRFLPEQIAVIGVQTRTMTDCLEDKAAAPVSYVMQDACRAVRLAT